MGNILTIVIPVRIDTDDRKNNLKAVLTWMQQTGCRILVLEADNTPLLKSIVAAYSQVEYLFVEDNDHIFHRTKYINTLLQYATSRYVAVWDADVIVHPSQVAQTIEKMEKDNYVLGYPYSGKFYMLNEDQSVRFRKDFNLSALHPKSLTSLMGRPACGGVYIVDRKAYLSIGGENEKFKGWGPEDAERLRRTQIMGLKAGWLSGKPLYHLHHKRNPHDLSDSNPNLLAMRKEFIRECCMTQDEMANYIMNEMS